MPAFLTRRVVFNAAHRYRVPEWSDERNEQVFGLCARPSFHGHTYVCDVTVTGSVDPKTGMLVDLGLFDRVLAEEVRHRLDHRNLNLDVPEFAEGKRVPTGEELARYIFENVQRALGAAATVTSVTVAEDSTLSSTYRLD